MILSRLFNDQIGDEECKELTLLAENFFNCFHPETIKKQLNQVLASKPSACNWQAIFEKLARVNLNMCLTLITMASPEFDPESEKGIGKLESAARNFTSPFAKFYPLLVEQLPFDYTPAPTPRIPQLQQLIPVSPIKFNNSRAKDFFCQLYIQHHSTALHFAVKNGYMEIVPALLRSHDCINLKNYLDKTALMVLIGELGSGPLDGPSQEKYAEALRTLLSLGADPNLPEQIMGNTALIELASIKQADTTMVTALLEGGADINAQNCLGYTALLYAVKNNHLELVQELVNAGANVNLQTKGGDTPLIYAVKNKNIDIVDILLEKEPDLNLQDEAGYTALTYAEENDSIEIANALVEKGAEVSL